MTTQRRDAEGEARWLKRRDHLLALAGPCRRPAEWWQFEAPVPRPHRKFGPLGQAIVLADLGELSSVELEHLRRIAERPGPNADDARHALDVAAGQAQPTLVDRGLR